MNVVINDAVVNVIEQGKGKPKVVLMLHGWGSDANTFSGLAGELAKSYHVIRFDFPGFGKSDTPPNFAQNPWGIEEYAKFIPELLNKLGIHSLHAVVAHSMGGRIALYGMGTDTFGADKLVLIGSHGIRESDSLRNQLYKAVAKVGKVLTAPLPKSMQQSLRAKLYKQAGSTDYLDAGNMQETFVRIINKDIRTEAGEVEAETLLIYGANDDQTPPAFGKQFEELITHAKLKVIPGAGHFVHNEKPEQVAKLVKDWL